MKDNQSTHYDSVVDSARIVVICANKQGVTDKEIRKRAVSGLGQQQKVKQHQRKRKNTSKIERKK